MPDLHEHDEHAREKGHPIVLMTQHDLAAVFTGGSIVVHTEGGGQALVRLWSADELIAYQHKLVGDGIGGVPISRDKAEELTRPFHPCFFEADGTCHAEGHEHALHVHYYEDGVCDGCGDELPRDPNARIPVVYGPI
jgi:hypothetical protein